MMKTLQLLAGLFESFQSPAYAAATLLVDKSQYADHDAEVATVYVNKALAQMA